MDNKIIDRVNALLAKAESTEHAAEQEAFFAKAQELIAAHAIASHMLGSDRHDDALGAEVVPIVAPYILQKAILLQAIATASGGTVLRSGSQRYGFTYQLIGRASARQNILALFASIQVAGVRAAYAADIPEWESARRFRSSFMSAFATRIGTRLREANAVASDKARNEGGGATMAIVLRDAKREIDSWIRNEYGKTGKVTTRTSSRSGREAGDAAGRSANIGGHSVSGGGRMALGA